MSPSGLLSPAELYFLVNNSGMFVYIFCIANVYGFIFYCKFEGNFFVNKKRTQFITLSIAV